MFIHVLWSSRELSEFTHTHTHNITKGDSKCLNPINAWRQNSLLENVPIFKDNSQPKIILIPFKLSIYLGCLMYIKASVNSYWCAHTDCDPMHYSVHGILQARILEWVAIPFSRGSSQPRDWTQISRIVGRFFYQLSHKGSPAHNQR